MWLSVWWHRKEWMLTWQGPGEARHEVKAVAASTTKPLPVQIHQLQDLMKQEVVDQVQTANSEIFWHLFLKEVDSILNVEPYHFAQRNILQFLMGEKRKSLKDEFMIIKVNDSGTVCEKVCRWWHGNAIMVQLIQIVAGRVTRLYNVLSRVDIMPYATPPGLDTAATQWPIVHLPRVIVPEFRVKTQGMCPLALHLLHPLAAHPPIIWVWLWRWTAAAGSGTWPTVMVIMEMVVTTCTGSLGWWVYIWHGWPNFLRSLHYLFFKSVF